jgi:ABC-type amino acid transport substrate-binding protein
MSHHTDHRRLKFVSATLLSAILLAALLFVWSAQAQPDRPLRVATKALEPFVILDGAEPAGLSVDLWAEIAQRLGYEYEWVTYETVGEILAAVENGEADVAIAGISMTRERETVIDFTHPYYDAGLQILVPAASSFSWREALAQFRSPGMRAFVVLGLLAGLVMSHFIYLTERRHNPDFQHGYPRGLWEALWWLLTIVANGEYPDKPTTSPARRLMTIAFWLVGLLLVAQFTATVTSALTVQQLASDVDGPEDLPGKRVVSVDGSTAAGYLADHSIGFVAVRTIEEAYPLLTAGEADAVVYDAPVLRYYSVTTGQGVVSVVGTVFKPEKYGIALPAGSELREPINAVLLAMYQDGALGEIESRWFSQ